MKKWYKGTLAVMLAATLVIAGCGSKQNPKEAVQASFDKSLEATSYEFKMGLKVEDLQMKLDAVANDPQSQMAINYMKNAELSFYGVYQKEPFQMEGTLDINLQGDMAINFKLPMVMTAEKMWVKVPNIAFLPIPEKLVNKYIEVDYKKLAELSGEPVAMPTPEDQKSLQKFTSELFKVFLSKYDEKAFFTEIAKKDAALPESVDANQIVKFTVTNDNLEQAVNTFVKDVAPAAVDVFAKEEYRKLLKIEQADIDTMKSEMKASEATIAADVAKFKKQAKINDFSITTAINKDKYPVHQTVAIDTEVNNGTPGEEVKLKLKVTNEMSKVNEKATFKLGIPKDVVTLEQLQTMF
ncbi:hypothetical protein [Paenibacillus sp. 481]|uniref:hypothetical protein n=1 Tax=Paenibacillus sp. 481 TaxID=2835869 RepID=UPI001E40F183|nr:hypothetical protein [Paenibacillus sp. 481]UHA75279.1 hypothetical protein KIK04_09865 [Paenibacillus sp. 481]